MLLDVLDLCEREERELDLTVFLEMCEDLEDCELLDLRLGLELEDLLLSLDLSAFSAPASSPESSLMRLNNMSTSSCLFESSSILTETDANLCNQKSKSFDRVDKEFYVNTQQFSVFSVSIQFTFADRPTAATRPTAVLQLHNKTRDTGWLDGTFIRV